MSEEQQFTPSKGWSSAAKQTTYAPLLKFIPNTAPSALLIQMTMFNESAEMLLQRVATNASQFDGLPNRHAAVLANKFNDL